MAARFSVAARSRVSFSSFVFAHVYAFAKVAQTATMGTAPVKNEPLFIEFTIFHVSSRRDFHPAGADSFFEVTTHPVRRMLCADVLWGALKREREKTLYYNYSVKKFKSLNVVRRATASGRH